MKNACLGTILCLTVHCGLAPEPVTAPGWSQFVAAVRNVAQLTPTYRYQFQNMRDWYFIVENDYDAIVPAFVHSLDLQVSGGLCWHLDRGAAHLNASSAQAQACIAAHSHKLCCAALQQRHKLLSAELCLYACVTYLAVSCKGCACKLLSALQCAASARHKCDAAEAYFGPRTLNAADSPLICLPLLCRQRLLGTTP